MLNPTTRSIQLSNNEYRRYSKQLLLNNITDNGQKRIKNSKVLIIGLGGLGNPIAIYLATSGIGHIGLVDKDKIELSNLNRQIMYQEQDINNLKVRSAKSTINKINYTCKVITHPYEINKSNSKELIRYYDLIIDTTDNFDTRYVINETCNKLHKTYIYGAVEGFIGQIGIFNYKDGITYENLYPKHLSLEKHNCNTNGIIGVSTGYIGILQATEAIKIITGNKNQLNNAIVLCNLMDTQLKIKKIYNQQNIINYLANNSKINNLTQVKYINQQKDDLIVLIDIRNNKEFTQKHIKKSINIPLQTFKIRKTLEFIGKKNNQKYFHISCETLHKSMIVARILKNHEVYNYLISNYA